MAVGVEFAAGGGLGGLEWIVGEVVLDFGDEAGRGQGFFDVVALEVDVGIDFVCEAVVALVAFETDVMGCGSDPCHLAVHFERRFPDAQVVARGDDLDGFGVGPAVVLGRPKR